jgi:hypothetical protein
MKVIRRRHLSFILLIISCLIIIPVIDDRYSIVIWGLVILCEIMVDVLISCLVTLVLHEYKIKKIYNYHVMNAFRFVNLLIVFYATLTLVTYILKNVLLIANNPFVYLGFSYMFVLLELSMFFYMIINRTYLSDEAIYFSNNNKRI